MRQYEKAAEKLGCWMRERAVGSSQLARQTGIDAGTLRDLLQARKQNISTRNLMVMARSFGMGMQELMDEMA